MLEEEVEMSVGIYKSYDALKNFKIKVVLRKVAPSFMVLEENISERIDKESETLISCKRGNEVEECTFGWQEKIFSCAEIEMYSNKDNCVTFLENNYHQRILDKKSKGEKLGSILYSYVEADISSEKFKHKRVLNCEKTNYFSKQMLELKKRPSISNNRGEEQSSPVEGRRFWPWKEKMNVFKKNHGQTMYIMAALPISFQGDIQELCLCTVHADENGTVYITPDFNQQCNPYTIDYSKSEIYEYIIQHASSCITKHEAEREKTVMKKLYARNHELVTAAVGNEFDMASDMTLTVHVFGEIVSASNFESGNLYIHYFLHLPQYWAALDTCIDGVTQTCKTKVVDENEVAYFCYPFHLLLTYQGERATDKSTDCLSPHLFVEAVSLDLWGNHHIEGYGYSSLPIIPGNHFISLNTWRPIGHSSFSKLRQFFIGDNPELEDPMYAGVPSNFQEEHFNKLGIQIQSSGTVCLRFHVLHQSQSYIQTAMENKTDIFDHLMSSPMQNSIAAILSAFQRARQRMMAVREMSTKDTD